MNNETLWRVAACVKERLRENEKETGKRAEEGVRLRMGGIQIFPQIWRHSHASGMEHSMFWLLVQGQKFYKPHLKFICRTHQVNKILVADLSISISVSQGKKNLQLVGVQFWSMSRKQVSETLSTDEAWILWVILNISHRRNRKLELIFKFSF